MELSDGRTVPDECIRALEELEERWPGSSFPGARGAISAAVLKAYTKSDVIDPRRDMIVPYIREVWITVLTYHQRRTIKGCMCGWARLGESHPDHVADVYEELIRLRDL